MKQAIVIGCGNIGFATIERLVSDGYCVTAFDLREPDYLKNLVEKNHNVCFVPINANDESSVRKAFSELGDDYKADFVLCTVGINSEVTPVDDFAKYSKIVDVNVMGNIIPIKELVNESRITKKGKIVVIGSTSGHFAGIALDPYAVSKWILVNICESLQHELKHKDITLEMVNPRSIQNVRSEVFHSDGGVTINSVINQIFKGGFRSFVPKYYGLFHCIERCFPSIFDFAFGLKPSFVRRRKYTTRYDNILITGASSGLGESLVHLYSKEAQKIFCVARSLDKLEQLKSEVESISGCQIIPIQADLSEYKSIDRIIEVVSDDHVDLLINNAGQHIAGSVLDCDIEVYRRSIRLNCLSHIYLTSRLIKYDNLPNCIANIISTTAVSGRTNLGIYSSPKAGLWAWTKVLRRNYGKQIQIVDIVPATFSSSLSQNEIRNSTSENSGYSAVSSSKENMTSEQVASIIVHGLGRKKDSIYIPDTKVKIFIWAESICPSLFRKLFS